MTTTTTTTTAVHVFVPDFPAEPGYRPRCRTCGAERHPSAIPAQRTATR